MIHTNTKQEMMIMRKDNQWRIVWGENEIFGIGTRNRGIYTDKEELLTDFNQCIFLQPLNGYRIQKFDKEKEIWKTITDGDDNGK